MHKRGKGAVQHVSWRLLDRETTSGLGNGAVVGKGEARETTICVGVGRGAREVQRDWPSQLAHREILSTVLASHGHTSAAGAFVRRLASLSFGM